MSSYLLHIRLLHSNISAALDESDIQILKTYVRANLRALRRSCLTGIQGQGPYAAQLKKTEVDIKDVQKRINEKLGSLSQNVNYYSKSPVNRDQGVGHWPSVSQPMGPSFRQATYERGASPASCTMYEDY